MNSALQIRAEAILQYTTNLRNQIATKLTGETEKRKVDPPRLTPVGCLGKRNGLYIELTCYCRPHSECDITELRLKYFLRHNTGQMAWGRCFMKNLGAGGVIILKEMLKV